MPSWELFDDQDVVYHDWVLPLDVSARVSVEQASVFLLGEVCRAGWPEHRHAVLRGLGTAQGPPVGIWFHRGASCRGGEGPIAAGDEVICGSDEEAFSRRSHLPPTMADSMPSPSPQPRRRCAKLSRCAFTIYLTTINGVGHETIQPRRTRPRCNRSTSQPPAQRALRTRDTLREGREHRGKWRARRVLRREDRPLAEGQAYRQESRVGKRHLVGAREHPLRRAHLPNQSPARSRLPQHARAALLLRWLRRVGSEVSHQGARHLLAAVSCALHAHHADPPDAR